MKIDYISFEKTGYFSQLICDYISKNENIKSLYNHFPNIENFKKQISEKQANFPENHRRILVQSIEKQYENIEISALTSQNIHSLLDTKTFTITTGHQLSLFTGPLYFIYKIISTINLCRILKEKYTEYQFVPIYWQATEDHDFEEINHFYLHQKKIVWNSNQTGMVGDFSTETLLPIVEILKKELGISISAQKIYSIFEKSYLKTKNLALATRVLVNFIFQNYGLVIIDGNDSELKRLFIPYFEKDLLEHVAENKISETISNIKSINPKYSAQVTPREINIFYLAKNLRERIVKTSDGYAVNNTNIVFSEQEILQELQENPEHFSPNVILRPVYQEVILPNLCYIGGGGEIAYWLELKSFFDAYQVTFPMLLLRNSVLLVSEKQYKKIQKLKLSWEEIFMKNNLLENHIVKRISVSPIDFTPQKIALTQQFENLYKIAETTDVTFLNMVKAQEVKQLKGLEALEKRFLKAQKRKYSEILQQITNLRLELFPNGSLQERINNFSEYLLLENNLIDELVLHLNPLDMRFVIAVY